MPPGSAMIFYLPKEIFCTHGICTSKRGRYRGRRQKNAGHQNSILCSQKVLDTLSNVSLSNMTFYPSARNGHLWYTTGILSKTNTMSPAVKLQIETGLVVFISTFLTSVGSQVATLDVSTLSWSLVLGLITTGIGVAARAMITNTFKDSLGSQIKMGSIK